MPALEPATARALSARLAVQQRTGRLPSLSAGLVRGGQLVWSDSRGTLTGRPDGVRADSDTQYRIGSITKTFVAVCVLRLRDQGRLYLGDRFEDHVPGSGFGKATIAQLLTHTSGLQAETNGLWWERTPGASWTELMASSPTQRLRAGTRHHYSNVGYAALGELVSRAYQEPWTDVVRRDLLEPLGMTRTTTRPEGQAASGLAVHPFADLLLTEPEHDAGAMGPAGQLWSTVRDLARWAAFLAGETAGLVAGETLQEMLVPMAVADMPGQPWQAAQGLGFQVWNVDGRRYAGHGGSMPGFVAGLQVDLETGDGVVMFANSTSGLLGTLSRDLLTLVGEREPVEPEAWYAGGSAPEAYELVGLWHWGPAVTMLKATGGGGIELGVPGEGRGARFRQREDGTWVGLDGYYAGEPLRIIRAPDGAVSHLDVASFRFTRLPYDPEGDIPGGVEETGWH